MAAHITNTETNKVTHEKVIDPLLHVATLRGLAEEIESGRIEVITFVESSTRGTRTAVLKYREVKKKVT